MLCLAAGIKPVVANHLELRFWNVNDELLHEREDRLRHFDALLCFMVFIEVGDHLSRTIELKDPTLSHDGSAGIADDICRNRILAILLFHRWRMDIETIGIIAINLIDPLLELTQHSGLIGIEGLHLVQQAFHEGFAKHLIVDVGDGFIEVVLIHPAFGKETVNVGVPIKRSTKGMEGEDEAGFEGVFFPVHFIEGVKEGILDGFKQDMEEITISSEIVA